MGWGAPAHVRPMRLAVAFGLTWGLVYASAGAIALPLASMMGRAARALARQEGPETAPR